MRPPAGTRQAGTLVAAAPVEQLLLVSLSCVGDAVMTTPVIQSLHAHFPAAVMDIVSDRRSSQIYHRCPFRRDILHKDKRKFLRGSVEILRQLRPRRYDLIVDLRTDGLAYLLRARKRYTRWRARPYGRHAVEGLMGVIRGIHGEEAIPKACLWLGADDHHVADAILAQLPGDRWLAMAPAVGGAARRSWPPAHYAELANRLADLFNGVILAGGPGEEAVIGAVAAALRLPFVDASHTTLLQAGAVLGRARMFVGSDSGLGHVAAAAGTPTLSFFSIDRPERVRPWGNHAVWLQGEGNDARTIPVAEAEARVRECMRTTG